MWRLAILVALVAGCGSSAVQQRRTLPEPIISTETPPEVERPEGGIRTYAVDQCRVGEDEEAEETGPGILFSQETAVYVGRLRIAYDELRGLYIIDQRTWVRMREVYQRHLDAADVEIERANERAERNWWEIHGDEVGLILGFVLGVGATIGIVAAVDATTTGI